MWQQDAYRMIQRRAGAARIKTRIGNRTVRVTGITGYLKNKGTLETAQHVANHESPRTTKLYDRRQDEISLDEVEKISIWAAASGLRLCRHFCRSIDVGFAARSFS
jgi:hypothetical protein